MSEVNAQQTERPNDEISFLDLVLVVAENLRILILVPLVAGLLALGIGYLTTPTFTATTRILLPPQQQSASAALAAQFGALAGLAGSAAGIRSSADQFVALLKSGPVLDAMIERFKLKDLWGGEIHGGCAAKTRSRHEYLCQCKGRHHLDCS